MKKISPLGFKCLRQTLNASDLNFATTDELDSLKEFIGQQRALEAIYFGVGIQNQGYNLYAMGSSGIGKHSVISKILKTKAAKQPSPPDWCYIYNFDSPEKPIAIELPKGLGTMLQQDMKLLIDEMGANIVAVFESDEYRASKQAINDEFEKKRKGEIAKINEGIVTSVTRISYKEQHKREKELQLKFSLSVIEPIIHKLKTKYHEFPQIIQHLTCVQEDMVAHVNEFVKLDERTDTLLFLAENPLLINYQVNLLVDNQEQEGAPVIFEDNPGYSNLISRVEHTTLFGALETNFTLIRAGALHRANNGYLIIEARKIEKDKQAWEGLKRALYARKVIIEPVEPTDDSARPISLEPMPIPLNVKVILLGERSTFYSLCENDPDFAELFKVTVDFDEQIVRNKENIFLFARLISTYVKKEKLKAFDASAVAAVIDYSTRLAGDAEKLSTCMRSINDLLAEANYWANSAGKKTVSAQDVKKAISAQIHRMDRTRELYYEDINRNFIIINTKGKKVGQVNCLSVVNIGKFSYGHPTRVTANVRMGRAKIIDIQKQVDLAGPIHSKGTLILYNFLGGKYNLDHRFLLSASIAFEQIYDDMDGDSASVGSLCALLSALTDIPIKQSIAVTGSIDQYGKVQSVGCVNEKIEGFYDICQSRGLTGKQGVMIPLVNVKNLMLREDIVEATKLKKFFIYPIENVDQAITLLTGVRAGKRGGKGKFPKKSVNYKVEKRLQKFSSLG